MSTVRHAARDVVTLVGRSIRTNVRDLETLLISIVLPVMIMALFVLVFGGALAPGGGYVDYVVPGVVLLCAGYGAALTAVAVAGDMSTGIVDRLRAMPVAASAVLAGHVAAALLRNAVATALVVAVALLLGFAPTAGPGGWLAAAGVIGLYVLALSWLSALVGLLAGGPDAANGFTFGVLFLPYLSSAFVPTDTLPPWLRGFAQHQPVTPVIETVRGFLLSGPTDRLGVAVAWCVGLLAVSVAGCALLFRRHPR